MSSEAVNAEAMRREAATAPAASAPVFVATFVAILGVIGLLLALDLFLARIDSRESAAHAASQYADGVALLAAGRPREALELFGAAVAVDRTNREYALGLARAQLADGRAAEAEETLRALLEEDGNDGAANLTMAHAMLRAGRTGEAKAYFHRAIFGRWGADSTARRAAVRFELIDRLAEDGDTRELLAELLPLEDAPPDSVALRRRLGGLFILAGSPARGAAMLREVLRRDPADGEAFAGMGDAALALGNFRTARADFTEASRLRPDDTRIAGRLALADTVLAIDPGARGIGVRGRYVRSRDVLARTLAALQRCGGGRGGPSSSAPLDSAVTMLRVVAPAADMDAAGEALLELASDLWSTRPSRCAAAGVGEEALAVVQDRLGR